MAKKLRKELEGVVGTLTDDIVKALDIKEEKKLLEQQINQLREEKIELSKVVGHLKSTRNKIMAELKNKEQQEEELKLKVQGLKSDKDSLESDAITLNQQIRNLQKEKSLMENSLEKTNDLLSKLKHEIADFDEEIRK